DVQPAVIADQAISVANKAVEEEQAKTGVQLTDEQKSTIVHNIASQPSTINYVIATSTPKRGIWERFKEWIKGKK
ncbi:hypothetical protein KKE60_05790, partial [Patescibacteria group bacterium]|nr:hypothetical protein [Patescibacteria group bacterium]